MNTKPNGVCPHCGRIKYVGMVTCGKSECQQESYEQNKARNGTRRARRRA